MMIEKGLRVVHLDPVQPGEDCLLGSYKEGLRAHPHCHTFPPARPHLLIVLFSRPSIFKPPQQSTIVGQSQKQEIETRHITVRSRENVPMPDCSFRYFSFFLFFFLVFLDLVFSRQGFSV